MKAIQFLKLQGLGNDFLVVPVADVATLAMTSDEIRLLCDRRFGVGADGIVFVSRSNDVTADFASRIFNSDGSEAGISGNGTRCAAAYLFHQGLWTAPNVRIRTAAGIKSGHLVAHSGARFDFEFEMGTPLLASTQVPMNLEEALPQVVGHNLNIGGETLEVTCLSMGNPQCILFVNDLDQVNLSDIGPLIEDHPVFPDRTNVEFVHVLSRDEVEILIWERGAGHTLSSGTGSCASAVASALNGLTGRNVLVRTEGGPLRVVWREDDSVLLTGPAEVICEGRWLGTSSSQ